MSICGGPNASIARARRRARAHGRALSSRPPPATAASLVVEGQAGVGKTELLRAPAARRGGRPACRCGTRAPARPAVRRSACAPAPRARGGRGAPDLLTAGAEPAAAVFAATGERRRAPRTGSSRSLQGLHWLVANLAARAARCCCWPTISTGPTRSRCAGWSFLAERLEDAPGAARRRDPARRARRRPGPARRADDRARRARRAAGAAVRAAATSDRASSACPRPSTHSAAACHRATGGNPFLLGELLDELAAERVAARRATPSGSSIRPRARRPRRAPPAAPAADEATGAGARGRGPRAVRAARRGGGARRRATRRRPSGRPTRSSASTSSRPTAALDFVHPVVRSAVYDQIPPLERQALHAAAAALLTARRRRASAWPGTCCGSRRPAMPTRVAALRPRGVRARRRGAPRARYLRRALEEPPDAAERGRGAARARPGRGDRPAARPLRPPPPRGHDRDDRVRGRGQIALDLGRALAACGDFRASVDVFDAPLRDVERPRRELGSRSRRSCSRWPSTSSPSTDLAAERWERRFAQLEAGERIAPDSRLPRASRVAAAPRSRRATRSASPNGCWTSSRSTSPTASSPARSETG